MAINVRLGARAERSLNALATRSGRTRSQVVREALDVYAATRQDRAGSRSQYDQWADVIGVVRLGVRDPNQTTGEQYTETVRRKAHARRSG